MIDNELPINEEFLDIAKRGIEETLTDVEEKKIYLNIVKNNKDVFRLLFIDSNLYSRIFNIVVLIFGSFDVLLYLLTDPSIITLLIAVAVQYFLAKKGSKDIVEENSYKVIEEYITTLEQDITEELKKKESLSLKREAALDKEFKTNIQSMSYIPNIKRVLKKENNHNI